MATHEITHLVIDDLRKFDPPPEDWTNDGRCFYVETESGALALLDLKSVHIKTLWLDHDLGWEEKEGRAMDTRRFARELAGILFHQQNSNALDYDWQVDTVMIVTINPVGRIYLRDLLAPFIPTVRTVNPTDYNLKGDVLI